MIPLQAVAGWLAGWALAGYPRRLDYQPAYEGAPPTVAVVIPARDEAARLPTLLAALAEDRPDELIVVDDRSTDQTAELARAAGAVVLTSDPPEGWTGRAWACQQGAEAATSDVVVFLDADTEPFPGFLRRLAEEAARTDGLVSSQPWHRVVLPYEHLSAVCNVVTVLGAGTGTPGPDWWQGPVAFGPVMAVARAPYLAAGGHTPVRHEVVEDLLLAAATHRAGRSVVAVVDDGRGIRYRRYPEGPGPLVEGWSTFFAAGATRIAPLRAFALFVWVTGAILGLFSPIMYVAFALQLAVLFRRAGSFSFFAALLWPIPFAAFLGILARSVVLRLLRRRPSG